MASQNNPDYLRSVAQAVVMFRDALSEFLELHHCNERPDLGPVGLGVVPAVLPRDDADTEEIARRHAKVSRAAGRAAAAVPLTGIAIQVQGAGVVDPFAAWQTITRPRPLLDETDILDACEQALGRLDSMILEAEAARPPSASAMAMHPTVWGAAARLWRDGHYRQAVAGAAEAVALMGKNRTGRTDLDATDMWQQAYSSADPKPGSPRLRWPGDPKDQQVSTMNNGLTKFAPGVQMTIRNSAAHGVGELDEQGALERLSVLSLLARWVDECELVEAPAPQDAGGTST